MKQGWEKRELAKACKLFTDGDWIESKDQSIEGIRLIQTGNIGFGEYLDKKEKAKFISEETFKRLKCTEVLTGDILVSRLPEPVGRSCIVPDIKSKMITAVDCTIIRTKENLLPELLRYLQLSNSYLKDVESRTTGTTRNRISRKNLGLIEIPTPPLPEQERIVAQLDQCFGAIDQAKANVEKNLQSAKELFQSQLNQIFSQKRGGWVKKKLGEVCEKTSNIMWQENQGVEFKYIDLTAVSRGSLQITETVTVNSTNAPSRAKKIIETNDVIFATTRPTLKRVAKITNQFDNQICSTGFVVLRSKKDVIEPEIIFYFLQTDMFMDRMESIQRGTSYPAATDKDVKETILPFPVSNEEQNNTIEKLDELRAQTQSLESHYQQELDALDNQSPL